MASRNHGIQRVLAKLQASVDAGDYYEAHQMYRTLYFRYLSQKKYGELLDLLYDGSTLLFRHNQQTSGADLAILLVDVLVKSNTPPSEEHFSKLSRLFEMIDVELPEKNKFLSKALQWSSKDLNNSKNGHPQFHKKLAEIFWKEKDYEMARHHFLHSTDGTGYAKMLIEIHRKFGFPTEVDLFIAQAVLQYLCLQNKTTAQDAFYSYTTQHPSIGKGPPYLLPLLNFICFLLKVVESGKLTAFTILCEQYQPSIKRDPTYKSYLDRIAQIFFGVPAPKPRPHGLFGNLLQSFLVGPEDSDGDVEPQRQTQPRASTSHSVRMDTDELD